MGGMNVTVGVRDAVTACDRVTVDDAVCVGVGVGEGATMAVPSTRKV